MAEPLQYVDPYAERLKLLREEVDRNIKAPPSTQMYSPEEQAQRAMELRRMQVLGQLGGISNDKAIMNISEPMLKRAMEASKPKYTEHGAFDETSGQFRYFPGYQAARRLEAQQKMLQSTELASAEGQRRWDADRQRAHEMSILKHSIQANAPTKETASITWAGTDPDTGTTIYNHNRGGLVTHNPDGSFSPYTGKPGVKVPEMPAADAKAYRDARAGIGMADAAKKAVKENPAAIGAVGWLPEAARQYVPEWLSAGAGQAGVPARALVGNVGSLKIHDRSGATVTAAETPRLRPFIPDIRFDASETIKQKLEMFKFEYQNMVDEIEKGFPLSQVVANVNKQEAVGRVAPPGGAPQPGGAPRPAAPGLTPRQIELNRKYGL